jgi:HlyD family secretion protein
MAITVPFQNLRTLKFWLALLLLANLTWGCGSGPVSGQYRTQPVKRLTLESRVVANGTVNPVTTVLVGTQVSGMITALYADFNSEVRQGQVVARIDPAVFEARMSEARNRLRQAQAEVAKARANLAKAATDHGRYERLWQENLVARDELDNAYTRHLSTQAELQAALAQEASARATLKEAETNLGYTTIYSPVDGVVISRDVDVGQTVAATFQTPTLFTIAQDLTKMQVETAVDEGDVGQVAVGQTGTFTVDAFPDTTFSGQVTEVRLAPQTVQNVVTYTVIISADNPELLLKPGMTATVSILTAKKENVLAVSNQALRFVPPPDEARDAPPGPAVWRLGPRRQLEPVTVVTGITDGAWTEIKAGDLSLGEDLVIGLERPDTQSAPHLRRPF